MKHDLNEMRNDALAIFNASLSSVDPCQAIISCMKLKNGQIVIGEVVIDPKRFRRIVVVGAGKASAAMGSAIEKVLGNRIDDGLIVVKYGHEKNLDRIRVVEASHPIPDDAGIAGAKAVLAILETCSRDDLVISVISGGGSALLPQPVEGVSLGEKQATTQVLLGCGASIHEINTIRKHLSKTKGGLLARAASPATVINLMLSDVVGDDMDVIASGPFVPDMSTFSDALDIIDRYGIRQLIPVSVIGHLEKGRTGLRDETPKSGDDIFSNVSNYIIASNIIACNAARDKAAELGYSSMILSSMITGNTTDMACAHAAMAKEVLRSGNPLKAPACIISGGETTVVLKGKGLGGRNQEFALVCAKEISAMDAYIVILSGGTDGNDGPTDAAGGMVDPYTLARGTKEGYDLNEFLDNNDAYHFLEASGDLIKTGPTLTNVMDIRIVLIR